MLSSTKNKLSLEKALYMFSTFESILGTLIELNIHNKSSSIFTPYIMLKLKYMYLIFTHDSQNFYFSLCQCLSTKRVEIDLMLIIDPSN